MAKRTQYELFTDGACLGNPGPGGWAFILRCKDEEVVGSGGEANTTNQRMEVTAVLRALESLEEPASIVIHADSKYVTDGLTKWMDGWLKKGWKNAAKKPVKNQDLWNTTWLNCETCFAINDNVRTKISSVSHRLVRSDRNNCL